MMRSSLRLPLAFILPALCAGISGCWSHSPADPSRLSSTFAEPLAPIAWPERDIDRARAALAATPKSIDVPPSWLVLEPFRKPAPAPAVAAPPAEPATGAVAQSAPRPKESRAIPPDYVVRYAALHGQGLLRVIDAKSFEISVTDAPGGAVASVKPITVDSMLRFVSFSTLKYRPPSLGELMPTGSMQATETLRALSARLRNLTPEHHSYEALPLLWEGLGMHIIRPADQSLPRRGLIVHLGGSSSGEIEADFLDTLAARGWTILSMPFVGLTGGSLTRFVLKDANGKTPSSVYAVQETPTTKQFLSPLKQPNFAVSVAEAREVLDDADALGQRIAAVVDDRTAEVAYAVEAALEYLQQSEPELAAGPVVLLGCSAGALTAPAVAARLPDRFAAAVLIGGACNFLDVAFRSALPGVKPEVVWAAHLDQDEQQHAAVASYLRHSRLDSTFTAAALRQTPTLMLHASLDAIVPSDRGTELWRLLGRPERRTFVGGHLGLFVLLPGQATEVDDWLRSTIPAGSRNTAGQPAVGTE